MTFKKIRHFTYAKIDQRLSIGRHDIFDIKDKLSNSKDRWAIVHFLVLDGDADSFKCPLMLFKSIVTAHTVSESVAKNAEELQSPIKCFLPESCCPSFGAAARIGMRIRRPAAAAGCGGGRDILSSRCASSFLWILFVLSLQLIVHSITVVFAIRWNCRAQCGESKIPVH